MTTPSTESRLCAWQGCGRDRADRMHNLKRHGRCQESDEAKEACDYHAFVEPPAEAEERCALLDEKPLRQIVSDAMTAVVARGVIGVGYAITKVDAIETALRLINERDQEWLAYALKHSPPPKPLTVPDVEAARRLGELAHRAWTADTMAAIKKSLREAYALGVEHGRKR